MRFSILEAVSACHQIQDVYNLGTYGGALSEKHEAMLVYFNAFRLEGALH